ncbi:MAG: hypothetical protein IJZ68_06155 [Bacteroidaceae bacterium]|nr:hypothetical protein [Bacteroidaceae bacterium]
MKNFNKISAILVIALVISLVGMLFTGCSTEANPNDTASIPNRFVEIGDTLNGYAADFDTNNTVINVSRTTYVVDRYSKVVYMYYYDGGDNSGADFIPLYNPDGTIMIYDGKLPN